MGVKDILLTTWGDVLNTQKTESHDSLVDNLRR